MARPGLRQIVLVLAVTLLSTACSFSSLGTGEPETVPANEEAAADLQQQFADVPGAVQAYVAYQDNNTVSALLRANLRVSEGTDTTAALDQMEEAVWLSEVDPLDQLDLAIATTADPPVADSRSYDLTDAATTEKLIERWGDRP